MSQKVWSFGDGATVGRGAAAERRREARWKYNNSPRGKVVKQKYNASPSGRAADRKYGASPSGKAVRRRAELKWRYNLTSEQLEAIRVKQNDLCAVCKRKRELVVDHDHESGYVRGLLCIRCNVSIGALGDDVPSLRRALQYLLDAQDANRTNTETAA